MIEVTWLIEEGVFPENESRLCEEIKKRGHRHILTKKPHHEEGLEYGPTIFYGSLGMATRLRRERNFVGNWCDLAKFRCSSYYCYFGDSLLNADYALVPAGDFARQRENLMRKQFGLYHKFKMFIRPDSAFKVFTGDVITPEQTLKHFLVNSILFHDDLILVSSPKKIDSEYRFIICNGEIAGASFYSYEINGTRYSNNQEIPDRVVNFVKKHLDYEPEICYTIDVCETGGKLKIVELNCFSCSGFYEADLSRIVELSSEAAIKSYRDIYC